MPPLPPPLGNPRSLISAVLIVSRLQWHRTLDLGLLQSLFHPQCTITSNNAQHEPFVFFVVRCEWRIRLWGGLDGR
ncbi:hypothetical protein L873DRAFT_1822099 [Choiromyces venosus 120613-1]|uniref:Uncharacterized protein n=1 Tax=Choiromyces venosus 120613-1 TaxID=1336337 RepID=A0A3N4IV51_9PEZI|nr:hypothetical protein L873DRAFT_1822099 [Choiromyces venosus 120613-1]